MKTFNFIKIFAWKWLLLAVCALPGEGYVKECQSKNQNAHLHLATKTPYRFLVNKDDSPLVYQGCSAEKIWMIVRHGTRNPSQNVIRKMREKLPIIRDSIIKAAGINKTSLCNEEVANLMNWTTELQEADEKRLTHEGEDEMIELAERYQNRFPDILTDRYANNTFKFRHTATQRTAESARYFSVGLFGRRVSRYVWFPEALYKDPILRFYKLCSRWRSEIKKNPEAIKERTLFERSEEMNVTLLDMSRRLGIDVSIDDAEIMYVTCAFETAWNWKTPSPWCSMFSESNLEAMEYYEDLEYYWVDGYGYNLTFKQACPAVRDMFDFLTGEGAWEREAAAGARAALYFTHSGTLLKLLAHLGLYRDPAQLLHHNMAAARARLWRVSRIDSFATNLAFVLFRCGRDARPHVLTLHQERPVTLPGCPAAAPLCPLQDLVAAFDDSLQRCDFDAMCSRTD